MSDTYFGNQNMTKLVIAFVDCEPDDDTMLAELKICLQRKIPLEVFVDSPSPTTHTKGCREYLENMHAGERPLNVTEGARYYSVEVNGKKESRFEISDEQDRAVRARLDNLMKEAEHESVDVLLATTCYALMERWRPEWLDKIRVVYHMGGMGLNPKLPIGFNWRVGTPYAHKLMETIPPKKLVLLEPRFYNPDMIEKLGYASVCPKTFPEAFDALDSVLCFKDTALHTLIDHNKQWLAKNGTLDKPNPQYYPDKENIHLWFGPADILLGYAYIEREFGHGRTKSELKEIKLEDKTYMAQSIVEIDYKHFEDFLSSTFVLMTLPGLEPVTGKK